MIEFAMWVKGFYNFYPFGIAIAAFVLFIDQCGTGYDAEWDDWLELERLEARRKPFAKESREDFPE